VIVNYMPHLPISIENKPIDADTWSVHFLQRSGQGNKYVRFGGFARQRPLPAGPWPSPYWREIDAAIDVLRVRLVGADAFAIDILQIGSGGIRNQARTICATAAALVPNFHIVLEIDSYVFREASVDDIVRASEELATCPAIYRLRDGRVLYVPFAANTHTPEFWREVKDKLAARGIAIAFVPLLQDLPRYLPIFAPISAGLTFWGARDPDTFNSKAFQDMERRAAALAPQYWIQPIAPQGAAPSESLMDEAANTRLLRAEWK
jgi:hypothetical protein